MKSADFLFGLGLTVLAAGGIYHENRFHSIRQDPEFKQYEAACDELRRLTMASYFLDQVPYHIGSIPENLDTKIEETEYEIKDLKQARSVVEVDNFYYADGLPIVGAGLLLFAIAGLVKKYEN